MRIPSSPLPALAQAFRGISQLGQAGKYTVSEHPAPTRPEPAPATFGDRMRSWVGRLQGNADVQSLAQAQAGLTRISDRLLEHATPRGLSRPLQQLAKAAASLQDKGGDARCQMREAVERHLCKLDDRQLDRLVQTWSAVDEYAMSGHGRDYVATLRSAIVAEQRVRTEVGEVTARKIARFEAQPVTTSLLRDLGSRGGDGAGTFRAMVAEFEHRSGTTGAYAVQATFDVLEQLLLQNDITQGELRLLVAGLPSETLREVARPGEGGGGPARVVIDQVLRETLQARIRTGVDLGGLPDAELGDIDTALRRLGVRDGGLAAEIAVRKGRAAEPFREAMQDVFESTDAVGFFRNLDASQARFHAVLHAYADLGERVEGGDGTAEAHYTLMRDAVDRQDLQALRRMHANLARPGMLACREAIAFGAQELLLHDPPEHEQQRALALFHLASLGMLGLDAAVADSLSSRDPAFQPTPPARSDGVASLTTDQRAVLEHALGLAFVGDGADAKPVLVVPIGERA